MFFAVYSKLLAGGFENSKIVLDISRLVSCLDAELSSWTIWGKLLWVKNRNEILWPSCSSLKTAELCWIGQTLLLLFHFRPFSQICHAERQILDGDIKNSFNPRLFSCSWQLVCFPFKRPIFNLVPRGEALWWLQNWAKIGIVQSLNCVLQLRRWWSRKSFGVKMR